jgi:hypothetical protein
LDALASLVRLVATSPPPHNAALAVADYTILNLLHAAMDEDVTDMILSCHQTAC